MGEFINNKKAIEKQRDKFKKYCFHYYELIMNERNPNYKKESGYLNFSKRMIKESESVIKILDTDKQWFLDKLK